MSVKVPMWYLADKLTPSTLLIILFLFVNVKEIFFLLVRSAMSFSQYNPTNTLVEHVSFIQKIYIILIYYMQINMKSKSKVKF